MLIEKVSDENNISIVSSLADEIWNEHFTDIIGKAQVDYMLDKFQSKKAITEQIADDFLYYVFMNNDMPIGYISVKAREDHLFLSKFYILADERGKGYGRTAIDFIEQLATELKLNKISLTINKYNSDSIAAYEKLGFINSTSIIQDIGNGYVMDDYIMEKSLDNNIN